MLVSCNLNIKYIEVNCNIFILEKKGFFVIKCLGNLGYIFFFDLKYKICWLNNLIIIIFINN